MKMRKEKHKPLFVFVQRNKMKKKILSLLIIVSLLLPNTSVVLAKQKDLPKDQREIANTIAKICEEKWAKYGVLPSVCVTQAFMESTLGRRCSGYNLWGIDKGKEQYSSLSSGVLRYLQVINNGCYKKAPFTTDYKLQLHRILFDVKGKPIYCALPKSYYKEALWSIRTYEFDKYDKRILKKEEEKKRKKQQQKTFTIIHDSSVPFGQAVVDKDTFPKGTILIQELCTFYDVEKGETGQKIRINNKSADKMEVHLDVFEDAVG